MTSRRSVRSASSVPPSVTIMRMNPSAAPYGQSRPGEEQLLDVLGDRRRLRPAQEIGRDEVAERRDERQQRGGDDPRHRQWQVTCRNACRPERVQVPPGRHQIGVQPVDRDEQRQDRERQEAVRHAEDHREVGVHEDDRLVREPDRLEDRVHDAVVAQQDHPRVGPDQVAGPEREHDEDDQQDLVATAVAADPVGDRIADRERQHRRDRRVPDRVQERRQEDRVERLEVVVQARVRER